MYDNKLPNLTGNIDICKEFNLDYIKKIKPNKSINKEIFNTFSLTIFIIVISCIIFVLYNRYNAVKKNRELNYN
jgi:hypothetical protein